MKQQHPSKEQVREYLKHRFSEHSPPPDIQEIRRQLGWNLVNASRVTTRK
jgi:hypothetical protein